jgi:TRAP-type C4-dicarboxylate transport system substrate-binding protein
VIAILIRALTAAAALMLAAATTQAATVWECYVYNPVATLPSVQAMVRLIDDVKQRTNGELEINLHLGGSLPIKASDITAAVGDSVVQLGDDGFATGTIPITAILRLPMLLQSYQDLDKAMAILRPHLDDAYGKRGIVVLGQYAYPFQVIWGKKKITSLADIKGLKLRVTSVEQGEFVRRFGGVSLPLGSPDVAAALDRGVVEGVFTASSGGGLTWHDLLKYRYGFPTSYVNSTIVVNREAFEKLPPASQQILRDAAAESAAWATAAMQHEEDEDTARFGKEGMVLTAASPEDIKEATEKLRPYWDEWAAKHSAEAVAILKEIRTAVGR